jgi:hypothetical protein
MTPARSTNNGEIGITLNKSTMKPTRTVGKVFGQPAGSVAIGVTTSLEHPVINEEVCNE